MTGRRYYITSLADWQRYAPSYLNSHWLALSNESVAASTLVDPPVGARHAVPASADSSLSDSVSELSGTTRILVLIEADEGVHLALEDDSAFEALPHPLASKPISDVAQSALAQHGVPPGATTFDATEAVARAHPLLRHRVF
jgi:hypothetical protein